MINAVSSIYEGVSVSGLNRLLPDPLEPDTTSRNPIIGAHSCTVRLENNPVVLVAFVVILALNIELSRYFRGRESKRGTELRPRPRD